MKKSLNLILKKQSDALVLSGFNQLVARDRRRKADFLSYLNEIDRRRIYAKEGYGTLFRFLTERFHFSESTALKRMQVAALARKYPFLLRDIANGVYSLTVLSRLSRWAKGAHATPLFNQSRFKSVREVDELIVARFPKADVEEALQRTVTPLGANRLKVQFMADKRFVTDLEKARALLSKKYPQGRIVDVLGLALSELVEKLEKPLKPKKDRVEDIPREIPVATEIPLRGRLLRRCAPRNDSRYIPREIRADVWTRDEGKCQYPRKDGGICGETHFIELDHIINHATGGKNTEENLRLLCWAHNQLKAELDFGKSWRKQPTS